MKQRLVFAALLLSLCLLGSSPVHAAGGGSTLPFNEPLTLIKENLTGPTADTIVALLLVCGLIAVGVSKETPWLKTIGGLAVICALIAKASTLPSALGLGSAAGNCDARMAALALSILWLFAVSLPLLPFLKDAFGLAKNHS
jgi:type IV secretory pathway VirB2 component (pilin)